MIDLSIFKKLFIGGVELKELFINGIQVWKGVSYTNQIPISTDASGNIYNGKGFKEKTWDNQGKDDTSYNKDVTGFIPCKVGDVIRFKNVNFGNVTNDRLTFYTPQKEYINMVVGTSSYILNTSFKGVKNDDGWYTYLKISDRNEAKGCGFIRVSCGNIDTSSVITINEEID